MTSTPRTSRVTNPRPSAVVASIPRLAGLALFTGPPVFFSGLLSSPPGDTTDTGSSITAFAAGPTQTQASGQLLHYRLILMALGLLKAPSLVSGRRGAALTVVGALATSLGVINVSGALKYDWWRMAVGQIPPLEKVLEIANTTESASLLVLWNITEVLSFLSVLLVLGGLGRAQVLSWGWPGAAVIAFAATIWSCPEICGCGRVSCSGPSSRR